MKPSLRNTALKTKLCLSERLSMNVILSTEANVASEIIALHSYEVKVPSNLGCVRENKILKKFSENPKAPEADL